jgi:hypothetical protein
LESGGIQVLRFSISKTYGLLLSALFAFFACSSQPYFPPPEADGGWRKNTETGFIRSLGIDPERLEEFGSYSLSVPNSDWKPYADFKGTLVIKDGWIIGEWYNIPEAKTFRTYLSSNGKAFAITCFGIMLKDSEDGEIDVEISPESLVYDKRWLSEGFPLSDPQKKEINFEQVFQHTSGLCPERTGTGEAIEQGRNEWTDYSGWILGHDPRWPQTGKVYFPPGHPEAWPGKETWGEHSGGYSSVSFGHLGLVLRNVYSLPASQFLWNRLLQPVGFSGIDYHAPPSEKLKWFSAGGLRMSPRDYARFAYFLLRDGNWEGEQLVPVSWIQRFRLSSRYPNIRSNVDGFFGQYPQSMFRIAGSGLNWAFIIPELDLIALRTGRSSNRLWDEVERTFLEKLFSAL